MLVFAWHSWKVPVCAFEPRRAGSQASIVANRQYAVTLWAADPTRGRVRRVAAASRSARSC